MGRRKRELMENKIISMYAKGMSTSDIEDILCLSSAVERCVEHILKSIQNIECEQHHYKLKQLVYVTVIQDILHEWLVQWNRYSPEQARHCSDSKISGSIVPDCILIFCSFLLYKLPKLSYRQQHPAPDKVIGHPVGTLLSDNVHHTRYHKHICDVSDE